MLILSGEAISSGLEKLHVTSLKGTRPYSAGNKPGHGLKYKISSSLESKIDMNALEEFTRIPLSPVTVAKVCSFTHDVSRKLLQGHLSVVAYTTIILDLLQYSSTSTLELCEQPD